MGDNVSEDDFEVDGVPVDYAGPGENDVDGTDSVHEAALVMDDDEGRVIDSVGPSDDLEEFNQMEPLGEGEGVKLDDAMEDNENRPASAKVTRPAEASSHGVSANGHAETVGDDDEPYLEIMVSEQGFDDVGEIEGEAVSRSDSDFGASKKGAEAAVASKEAPSSSKSAKEDKDRPSSTSSKDKDKDKETSRKSSPATSSSRRQSERIKQRDETSSTTKKEAQTTKPDDGDAKNAVKKTEEANVEKEVTVAEVKDDHDSKKEKEQKKDEVSVETEKTTGENAQLKSETANEAPQPKAQSPEIEPPSTISPTKSVITDPEAADWYVSIRNLPAKTTANDLKEKLAIVAPVLSCTIFLRKADERYAMVRFRNAEECNLCVEKFNGTELDGNTVTVQVSPKRRLTAVSVKSESKSESTGAQGTNKKDTNKARQNTGRANNPNQGGNNRPQAQHQNRGSKFQNNRFRARSPIRPPNRSPDRNGRSRLQRGPSPHRHVGSGLLRRPFQMSPETDRRRQEFEERRRVMEWKRTQQERMRREEDLMRKKAEVETLRLEKERERLKLERERLEAERIHLERQKHRDREQLDRDKRRREEEDRRLRIEKEKQREREREKEREREREKARERERERDAARLKDKRPIRDSGRDDRDVKKRRSVEPSNYRSGGGGGSGRDERRQPEKLIVRTDSYQRRHVSPPRRGVSPPAKGSGGGRSEANDRFGATRSGERGGMSSRPFDDRDRRDGGRINGNGDSFRGGDRLPPGDFGRRESGRGDQFGFSAPNSGNYGIGSSAPVPSSAPYTPSYNAGPVGNGPNPPAYLDRGYGSSNQTASAGYRGRY